MANHVICVAIPIGFLSPVYPLSVRKVSRLGRENADPRCVDAEIVTGL
jgi:hypothetical protein